MSHIYVLDWLVNKPVKLTGELPEGMDHHSLVVYKGDDDKEYVGELLGYQVRTQKTGSYLYPLTGQQAENFSSYQKKAADLYEIFKKDFAVSFPDSKPITARMNLQGNQIYFYFFAETRFDFAEFVKGFRQKIGYNFFLYQVGARDRVRIHPDRHNWFDASGQPLMYTIFRHPLENVEGDVIGLQNLEGRDIETLKDRSGKLDHTLNFEKDIYEEENKKYPKRGDIVHVDGKPMRCNGINILTQKIKLRGKGDDESDYFNGEFLTLTLKEFESASSKPTPRNRPQPRNTPPRTSRSSS